MRFRDIRRSVVKRTGMDEGTLKHREVATVQRISPWKNSTPQSGIREGLQSVDIFHPLYNRASRRANGQVRQRNRLRGTIPPHPLAVINKAHRMQRNCSHAETYTDGGVMYCSDCHLEVFSA